MGKGGGESDLSNSFTIFWQVTLPTTLSSDSGAAAVGATYSWVVSNLLPLYMVNPPIFIIPAIYIKTT